MTSIDMKNSITSTAQRMLVGTLHHAHTHTADFLEMFHLSLGALSCIKFTICAPTGKFSIWPHSPIMSVTMLRGGCAILILLILHACAADAEDEDLVETLHEEARLHTSLLKDYNSDYRPVRDYKNAVNVKVRLALKYLSFDSLEETMTVHSWLAITWKDEFLKWNPSDYSNIKEIQMESHLIWTPRLALFNSDATSYESDSLYTTCLVASDGTVTCVPHLAHFGICRTTLRNWPYDTQKCSLFFGSWMHTGEQINFTFYKTKPIVLDDYQNGPGWKLLNVTNERLPGNYGLNSTYPMLKYTFKLEREAAGPAAIVVVPSVVVIFLTLTSLLLDIKDNTRLTLVCFSLFLHFIVLTEIGYDIPKHSADTPIILLFLRDSMIVTLMAILVTLFLMYLRSRTVPTPVWIVSLNRLVSSGPGKYVVFTEFDPSNMNEEKTLAEDISGSHSNDGQSRAISDWIQLANVLNSCIFIISLLVYFVLLCLYIPKDS